MRPAWDEVWLNVADEVSARSRCIRRYGAVIVTAENRIVATGFNGQPATMQVAESCASWCPHAMKRAGEDRQYQECFSIHAEANSLMFCDRRDREGGTIYVTGITCWGCALLIANSGLARCVMRDDGAEYRGLDRVLDLFKRTGIECSV